ncbi:hypothetical protein D3C81_566990 [compost metagenome]
MGRFGRRFIVVAGDDLLGQPDLHVARVQGTGFDAGLEAFDVRQRAGGEQLVVVPHQGVGDGHDLAEHLPRGVVHADVVGGGLGHLLDAVQTHQQRHHQHALGGHAGIFLQLAAHQQVELLIGTAELHVRFQRDRVIALQQRIEEFVNGDGLTAAVALLEVVALHHAGHCLLGRQLDHAGRAELAEPAGVVLDAGLRGIQDLERLLRIGEGVVLDGLFGERRAGAVLAGGIPHHGGEVADQQNDLVTQILEGLQLVEDHGVTQVNVRSRRVHPQLDAQRAPFLQLGDKFFFNQNFFRSALDLG